MTGGTIVTVDVGDLLSAPPATENSIPPQSRDNNQVSNDAQPVNIGGIDDTFSRRSLHLLLECHSWIALETMMFLMFVLCGVAPFLSRVGSSST